MQNDKKYPFKYLDAYTRDDKDFYFGRDEEVKELYEMTFRSNLLLVYGASGTGKTSLIQCGLANCFETHNWLALTIRRNADIDQSLEKVLDDAVGNDIEYFSKKKETENEAGLSPLAQKIKLLRLKYFRPIYLIFDQFEELYILGSKKEQENFYQTVKQLLALNQPVKIIISIREEYLGHLYDFEQVVPDILRKKLRIEPMTLDKVRQVLQGINNLENSLVTLKKGEEDDLIQAIFDKLREGKISIDLPYLQVLLDKLYLIQTYNDEEHKTEAVLTCAALGRIGTIGDILFSLLVGLVSQLKANKNIEPETAWKTLSCFVTVEGTKEPKTEDALQEQLPEFKQNILTEILQFFVSKRILRCDGNKQVYEIAHDALAKQIHGNRSVDEVERLQIKILIRDISNKNDNLREFFTPKQLKEIDSHLKHLKLTLKEENWINQSREEVQRKQEETERFEKQKQKEAKRDKKRKRRESLIIGSLFVVAVFSLIIVKQSLETGRAKQKAQQEYQRVEKLINAFYFYDGKFALACGEKEQKGQKEKVFYFINENGDAIDALGYWDKAEQFDESTGFAEVVKSGEYKGQPDITYLIDTLGNRYKYTNKIDELDNTIQALDLSGQNLSELPKKMTNYTNLKYLNLNLNELRTLPVEIGKLTKLTRLYLRNNKITSLPPEIGELTKLTQLELSFNELISLPTEIENLTNLTDFDWTGNPLDDNSIKRAENLIERNIKKNDK